MTEHIPQEFIQQLLSRIEIVDLIDSRVPLRKKTSSNFFACCPFHTEKNPSFSVSQSKQFYYCFGCGAHGNAIDFVMQYDHLGFPETIELLACQAGLDIPQKKTRSESRIVSQGSYELLEKIALFYQKTLKRSSLAIDYLKRRGLSGMVAKEFELGFAEPGWDHVLQTFGKTMDLKKQLHDLGMLIKKEDGGYYDRFRDRIMFPIRDKRGRIVGFGGRILEKGDPKYLNSPETSVFQKGQELYGLYHTLKSNRQLSRIILVEGYMDVIALYQHGITYSVATLGTATTSHHLHQLFRHVSDIIFCFDGDQAGRQAAWRALLVVLPLMRDDIQIRFMFLPDGEDPDSLIRKKGKPHFEQCIDQASALSTFFFQSLANQVDLTHMDGRARFATLATEHLNKLPDGIFKQLMMEDLAKRVRIDIEHIKQPITSAHYKKNPVKTKHKPRSALTLAILLLLQQPELAQLVTDPMPLLDSRGFDIFLELLKMAKNQTNLKTGAIIERWRNREEAPLLAKLAQTEHMIPESGIENEFLGAIAQLRKLAHQQAIHQLLAKANQAALSEQDKLLLNSLINSKN